MSNAIPCSFRGVCFNAARFIAAYINTADEIVLLIDGTSELAVGKLEGESDEDAMDAVERFILAAVREVNDDDIDEGDIEDADDE